jgi:hypothetical protein
MEPIQMKAFNLAIENNLKSLKTLKLLNTSNLEFFKLFKNFKIPETE